MSVYDGNPLVTVCIPSHRPHLLREAKDSVYHAIEHMHQAGLARDVQTLTSESPLWWPTKIQDILYAAAGRYVLVLPDDDTLDVTALTYLLTAAKNSNADIIYGDQRQFGDRDKVIPALPFTLDTFKDTNPIRGWSALVRASLIRSLGGIDTSQQWQDYDLFYRCFKKGATACLIPFVTHHYRWHADMGSKHMDHIAARQLLLRKHPELAL